MRISFQTTPPPLEDTLQFESVYAQKLQTAPDAKAKVIADGYALWLLANGKLVGELYGVSVFKCREFIPDVRPNDFYLAKLTVLPGFQNRGLGRLLFTYFLAEVGIKPISWHAASVGMANISDLFGAKVGPIHENWFDTGKPAVFRYLDPPSCKSDCPICGGKGLVTQLDGSTCQPLGLQPCPRSKNQQR